MLKMPSISSRPMDRRYFNASVPRQRYDRVHAFKNHSHLQCSDIDILHRSLQNEWIDKFEVALKFNQNKRKKQPALSPPAKSTSPTRPEDRQSSRMSYASTAPLSPTSTIGETVVIQEKLGPDWLLSAGEEIQSLTAQRHFEETLALIVKCEEQFATDSTFHKATEVADKVSRSRQQSEAYYYDNCSLSPCIPDKTLEGSFIYRIAVRAVQLPEP